MKEILRSIGSILVLAILIGGLSFGIFKHEELRQTAMSALNGVSEKIHGDQNVATVPTDTSDTNAPTQITDTPVATVRDENPLPQKKYRIDENYNVVPTDPSGDTKIVLLTIDDGPKAPKTLDPILKAMADENVHALFFVLGNYVKSKPEYLKEISDAGHTIGNHTWDHQNLKSLTNEKAQKEIDDTTDIIEKTIGTKPEFFRPPYAASTEYVKNHVSEENMLFMTWSLGGEDWVTKYQTKDALTKHVIEGLHPGANILLHELSWTAAAMPDIISKIKAQGYTIIDPSDIEISS